MFGRGKGVHFIFLTGLRRINLSSFWSIGDVTGGGMSFVGEQGFSFIEDRV